MHDKEIWDLEPQQPVDLRKRSHLFSIKTFPGKTRQEQSWNMAVKELQGIGTKLQSRPTDLGAYEDDITHWISNLRIAAEPSVGKHLDVDFERAVEELTDTLNIPLQDYLTKRNEQSLFRKMRTKTEQYTYRMRKIKE